MSNAKRKMAHRIGLMQMVPCASHLSQHQTRHNHQFASDQAGDVVDLVNGEANLVGDTLGLHHSSCVPFILASRLGVARELKFRKVSLISVGDAKAGTISARSVGHVVGSFTNRRPRHGVSS